MATEPTRATSGLGRLSLAPTTSTLKRSTKFRSNAAADAQNIDKRRHLPVPKTSKRDSKDKTSENL
jgi:hypothetical protein